MKQVLCDDFRFHGKIVPAATASVVDGPWAKADTSAAGAPTLAGTAGFLVATLAADDEAENLCFYHGDILSYDIDDLIQADFWIKCTADIAAAVQLAFGMIGNRNDAIDSIAQAAIFRLVGNNNVLVESDDGTNDKDDIATGLTLSTTLRRFTISFKEGIQSVSGGLSTGGKSNVIFSAENSQGLLRRVAEGTRFNMENYSGGLQPFVQLQKTGGAEVPAFSLKRVKITYRGYD